MARKRPTPREDNPPGYCCFTAVQLAIDKISDPAKPQADRRAEGGHIDQRPERNPFPARKQRKGCDNPQETAVEGHPPFPHRQQLKRIFQVKSGIVEQDISKSPAQHNTHGAPEDQIGNIVPGERQPLSADFGADDQICADKTQNVHQPVPAELERADA